MDASSAGPRRTSRREVRRRLVAEGHDEGLFSIVASGPNSASPHHEAVGSGHRRRRADRARHRRGAGRLWVATSPGRCGSPAGIRPRARRASSGGSTTCSRMPRPRRRRPSGRASPARRSTASRAASSTPRATATQFIHRTGHGIGLEGHEEPYLVAGNAEPLEPGMALQLEPGIYLEGRYGARIEDIVVCGDGGPTSSTRRRATCSSSTADDPRAARGRSPRAVHECARERLQRTARYHRRTGRPPGAQDTP